MESTYGDREHETPEPAHETMAKAIEKPPNAAVSCLRSQSIVPRPWPTRSPCDPRRPHPVPPRVCGLPMGLRALTSTDLLTANYEDIDVMTSMGSRILTEGRTGRFKRINHFKHSCIIVTSSECGGGALHHLERLPDEKNRIITAIRLRERGRKLIDGRRTRRCTVGTACSCTGRPGSRVFSSRGTARTGSLGCANSAGRRSAARGVLDSR